MAVLRNGLGARNDAKAVGHPIPPPADLRAEEVPENDECPLGIPPIGLYALKKKKIQLIMNIHTLTADVGTNPMTFETGKIAKLADGAVTVRCGDTIILVTAVSATKVKSGQTWFCLLYTSPSPRDS